ncbi:MAG: JAB domain-containing protein, partial [Acidobacteriota bacterium]
MTSPSPQPRPTSRPRILSAGLFLAAFAALAAPSAAFAGDALSTEFGLLIGRPSAEPSGNGVLVVPGIGPERAVRIHAALELGRRASRGEPMGPDPVRHPDDARAWLVPGFSGLHHEELHGLFLDRQRRVLAKRRLTVGSDSFTVVDPRQVFRVAIGVRAQAVVLAHNHPSG